MKEIRLTETAAYPGMTTVMEKGKVKARVCIPRPWGKGPHSSRCALRGSLPGLEPCPPAPSVQCSLDWLWSWKGSFHHSLEEEEGSIITLVGREEKPFPAPPPPASGFSRVPFPIPWPSPDLWSVSSKQKRACFMPSQIKWHQLRAPSFTLSLKWILAPVAALCPTGGMRWWLAGGPGTELFHIQTLRSGSALVARGWEDWKN